MDAENAPLALSRKGKVSMLRKIVMLWWVLPAFGASNAALIASLVGTATTNQTMRVSSLDWLAEGAVLCTGEKSKAVVILLNGRRFEVGANARATIGPTELRKTSGPVREMVPLPPLPLAAPLDVTSDTVAAVRFRGATNIQELCPREGMAVLPGAAKLSFHQVEGATVYQVVLDGEDGNTVVQQQTSSTKISVPPLQPASRYSWRVRALGKAGGIAEDRASFVTFSKEQVHARQAFANAIGRNLALLAEIDFESGLVCEALDGFRAVLKINPGDTAMRRGLARVESALAGK
jgi:hypothetical protein